MAVVYIGCIKHEKGILKKIEHNVEGLWMLEQDILEWVALNLNNFTISNIYMHRFY